MSSDFMDKEALAFADELIAELKLGQESRAQLAERIDKFRKQVLTKMVAMLVRTSEARKKDDEPFYVYTVTWNGASIQTNIFERETLGEANDQADLLLKDENTVRVKVIAGKVLYDHFGRSPTEVGVTALANMLPSGGNYESRSGGNN
jgi:hypothetical protein